MSAATLTAAETAELATMHARFAVLSDEWNALNRAINLNARDVVAAVETPEMARQADVARELKHVGERISTLGRQQHGGDLPNYNEEGGAR